jgi:hypothetical protein
MLARKQANLRKLGRASVLALWVVVLALIAITLAR